MISITKYIIFGLGLYLLFSGTASLFRDLRHPNPVEMTVHEFVKARDRHPYVTLTDARVDLTQAIPLHESRGHQQGRVTILLVPIFSVIDPLYATSKVVLATRESEWLYVAEKLRSMDAMSTTHYVGDHRGNVIRTQPLSGRIAKKIPSLDSGEVDKILLQNRDIQRGFTILGHNQHPSVSEALSTLGFGFLLSLSAGCWIYFTMIRTPHPSFPSEPIDTKRGTA